MGKAVEDPGIIHSDDGVYTIRLGKAITKPKEKTIGACVAVHEAIIIRPFTRKQTRGEDEKNLKSLSEAIAAGKLSDESRIGKDSTRSAAPHRTLRHTSSKTDAKFSLTCMKQICKPGDEPFSPQAELSDQDIIVKIFTVNYGSRERGDLEVAALKCLTAGGCKHAPTYLGDFKKKLDGFPKGEIRYVLMSRLPGYSLADRETWNVNAHRRDRVEKAFGIAIRSVHSCHIHNSSPYLRNILWSPENEMCYIVDFERAELDVPPAEMPEEWSDFDWWAELGGQLD